VKSISKLKVFNGNPQLSESYINSLEQPILADVLMQKIDNIEHERLFPTASDKFESLITSVYRQVEDL